MKKILITPRSFGKNNNKPIELLKEKGYEIITNPYQRIMTQEEMSVAIRDVDGIVIGVDPLNGEVLKNAKQLKAISKYGVGLDNIDLAYAEQRGIIVTKTVGANTGAVADFAVTLMLATARRMVYIDQECRQRNWAKVSTIQMDNKTLGLIGLGSIAKAVVKKVSGFDMKIIAYDTSPDLEYAQKHNITYVDLETLLQESDFISIHLPLLDSTKNLISSKEFALMKQTAVLVNTARGGIIDEAALLSALKNRRIWGAGIDVFEAEPPSNDEFLKLDNIIIGSHCAASTFEAIDAMGMMAAENLINSLETPLTDR
ncbi:hydroxyacid dehydrogenase [Anaerosporomusa subterranea]|uniref:Hydroxyacid dehydrogenase n=1 Tax=Anaerosporomusa subterranea TaxID=1794912 RepID=A0A154BQQ9_ANASB|nr:phosphoglycerate dehydrogenase [Anaerosporomusa subterranea]KYZ76195.1 hydroxyacid dehydrogenase [Anaerosporomusa subterranea]